MKNGRILLAMAATAALNVQAADGDLAELQKQVEALSAKIAQLEEQQADKIAEIEKKQADIPSWVSDMKIKGDFRYRYENRETDGSNSKDRQRIRARIGVYGDVNDYIDYGVRLATGSSPDSTSANQTLGDDFDKKDIWLDLMYVDIHPEQLKGAHLLLGKMPKPWLKGSGLIWDGDINPEGVAIKYDKQFENAKLITSAGGFVIDEAQGSDARLFSAQAAVESKVAEATILAGASLYHVQNEDNVGSTAIGNNNYNVTDDFNLIEGFGSVSTKIADLPVKFYGQYVVNTEGEVSDDTAYLLGVVLGKAKAPGSWEIGYNWRDTGRDAVMDSFNDSDFADGDTGAYGHQVKAKYQVAKNWQAGATYFNTVNGDGLDEDMVQLDLVFKF